MVSEYNSLYIVNNYGISHTKNVLKPLNNRTTIIGRKIYWGRNDVVAIK